MNPTPLLRPFFSRRAREAQSWCGREADIQQALLRRLLSRAASTDFGRRAGFASILASPSPVEAFRQAVPLRSYEDFREDIMRMIHGEKSVLWPGLCRNFAQSSGTTGGRSKYIPVTDDGLRLNHYRGAAFSVALYLASNPASRMFAGKGLILGGSFATEVVEMRKGIVVGDLSATLIDRAGPFVGLFRAPDKHTALLEDWQEKLPLIAAKAAAANVTNLSGVPSWMMQVLIKVLEIKGATSLREVWPGLEVFFHGGISFAPYREEYRSLCAGLDMHFAEVYNASEGFFACMGVSPPGAGMAAGPASAGMAAGPFVRSAGQSPSKEVAQAPNSPMLLLVDAGVFFEFLPLGSDRAVGIESLQPGKVYELAVSTVNGLWRYRIGDTVRVEGLAPLRISVAGRTKSFINAFGEELMEDNAERALAEACRLTGASIVNYTVAPVYAHGHDKGRHQWLIEWKKAPESAQAFATVLDAELRRLNSDYDAKRNHDIFLDLPEVTPVPHGTFHRWLSTVGSGKLGGQRKVPRLSNDRTLADSLLNL